LVDRGEPTWPAHLLFRDRRACFLIAHELGHVLFYDRTTAPPRRVVRATNAEERFCDVFAERLLAPPPDGSLWSDIDAIVVSGSEGMGADMLSDADNG
jgi:hypothetical protein